ncbi:MAG: protein translocase subunit SecD [Actinobacteria bacterium HGW-Actinobacteria-10]|jgi:preprotein translocase subunit SecD/SecD/SecF fusion protein|nr:MAG: protein translocase subunit SecD [Actinobacteria bacterium HGW-Actinobacteria-10]
MDSRQRNALALVVVLLLAVGAVAMFWPIEDKITQGLDIQGGLSVILTAEETSTTAVTNEVMDRAELIVRNRVDRLGATEATIQRQGADSILVQLPGIDSAKDALEILGSTGQLEFVDVASINDTTTVAALSTTPDGVKLKPGTYTPIMTGEVVTGATIGTDNLGKIEVQVTMDENGSRIWGEYTSTHINQQVAIVLDGVVQSAPVVQGAILGGNTAITGDFTPEEAKKLRTVLETGALPVTLRFSESRVVGPTLGRESLNQGLYAGLVGIAFVVAFMVLYYRGLGVLSAVALGLYGIIFFGFLAVLSAFNAFSLTLPGIAGLILTIGVAADTSILIFERLKEEIATGKTYRTAAKSAVSHAISTSIDADIVTLVSAIALYFFAIGPVRGFAFTLMIGIVIDLIVAILFTGVIVRMLAEGPMDKRPALFGMKGGDQRG